MEKKKNDTRQNSYQVADDNKNNKTNGNGEDNDLGEFADYNSYLGTPKQILCKFIMFAVVFSLNHGCVTGLLAYVQVCKGGGVV